jgi:hypothetical protein
LRQAAKALNAAIVNSLSLPWPERFQCLDLSYADPIKIRDRREYRLEELLSAEVQDATNHIHTDVHGNDRLGVARLCGTGRTL